MKPFDIPNIDKIPRVCTRCLCNEGEYGEDAKIKPEPGCKHRFAKPFLLAGLMVTDTYGFRSEQSMYDFIAGPGSPCWGAESFIQIRRLTTEEARAIRDGTARLVIAVEPTASDASRASATPDQSRKRRSRKGSEE